jgi:hypothetical protein
MPVIKAFFMARILSPMKSVAAASNRRRLEAAATTPTRQPGQNESFFSFRAQVPEIPRVFSSQAT